MNKIQKQKGLLIGLGVAFIVISVLLLVFGIILTVNGANKLPETWGIVKLAIGVVMIIVSIPFGLGGIRGIWIGLYMTATKGSIKEGNIAKEGGTINMIKCDKCGTEIKDGETACSNCGKPFERK